MSFNPFWFFAVVAIVAIFFLGHTFRVYQSCDGVVVKNTFDWPVCVEGSNR